jgi:hypothetical protein
MVKTEFSTLRAAWGCLFAFGAALPASALISRAAPEVVSPAGGSGEVVVEARCPTFSWAGVEGARGYELVVLKVPEGADGIGEEAPVIAAATLSAGARSWTPSLGSCLERGGRYAWSVRAAIGDDEGPWAEPALFRVAAVPSAQEVEAAMETLRRYLEGSQEEVALPGTAEQMRQRLEEGGQGGPGGKRERAVQAAKPLAAIRLVVDLEALASSPELVKTAAPVLGSPSLSLSDSLALGPGSNVFKDGEVFLWNDASGNFGAGHRALASASGTATNNIAVGRFALENTSEGTYSFLSSYNTALGDRALRNNTTGSLNTASGANALASNTTGSVNTASGSAALLWNTTGSQNTASGYGALLFNTSGSHNTASGYGALFSNTTGSRNTASGAAALVSNTTGTLNTAIGTGALLNTTGSRNTAVGTYAGLVATTGDDNIYLGSGAHGAAGEGNTIRIGGSSGTGPSQQNRAFIAGVRGRTTGNADAIPVLVDSAGQLGTVSSSREVKRDIRDIGELAERLLELRPVAFRYNVHAEADPATPLQFGLIAEEVAEAFPELVVYDPAGRVETVKYHLLAPLLLHELKRQERQLAELAALRERVAALEANEERRSRDVP